MATPSFKQTGAFHAGTYTSESPTGGRRIGATGVLTLDGSQGAAVGDIPQSLFGGYLESVAGGINAAGTQFVQFVVSPDRTSLLSLNASGAPTDAPADSYQLTVISVA